MCTAGTLPSDSLLEPRAKVRVHSLQSAAHAGRNGNCGSLGEFSRIAGAGPYRMTIICDREFVAAPPVSSR